MSETPKRYGANSSEQEQWVLDGKLYSGNPADQRQAASPSSLQQPVSSPGQAAEQASFNQDRDNNFVASPDSSPQNNIGEQNNFGFGSEPSISNSFGTQNGGGNNFSQPQVPYGQNAPGYGTPNAYAQAQYPSAAGNNFPTPPGYPGVALGMCLRECRNLMSREEWNRVVSRGLVITR